MTKPADQAGYGRYVRTKPRPPLSARLRPGHWTAIDYAAGAVYGLIVFSGLRPGQIGLLPATRVVGLILAVGTLLAVGQRRRRPWLALGLLLGGSLLTAFITADGSPVANFFLPVAYVLYYIVADFEERRGFVRALVIVMGAAVVDLLILTASGSSSGQPRNDANLVPVVMFVGIAWSIGYIVRQRRRYSIGLQVEAASKAVAEERLRIARELHDVVAHSMSVIAVQAGYGQYVIDSQPADARAALGAIQATSREALDEMRRMLGALRAADEPDEAAPPDSAADPTAAREPAAAPLFPAPGLSDLDRLVTRTASAGVEAAVARVGNVRELPPSIDLSAYRIIQEALTNVVKHAQASRCDVLLDYGDDELRIEITDSGAGVPAMAAAMAAAVPAQGGSGAGHENGRERPRDGGARAWGGSGHGIIGMRERVSLLGGSFSAGPLSGYGFRVSATIPLPHGAA
jgi:signal transduction histidine kinase